jgi:hypothetical protein
MNGYAPMMNARELAAPAVPESVLKRACVESYPAIQRQRMRGTITVPLGRNSCSYQASQVRTAFGGR